MGKALTKIVSTLTLVLDNVTMRTSYKLWHDWVLKLFSIWSLPVPPFPCPFPCPCQAAGAAQTCPISTRSSSLLLTPQITNKIIQADKYKQTLRNFKKSPEYNAKYILDIPKDMSYLFKASALWADAFKMSMCLFVCFFVCVFTFEVPFKRLFAPSLVAGLEGWVVKPMFDTLEKSKRTQARLNTAGRNSTQFRKSNWGDRSRIWTQIQT